MCDVVKSITKKNKRKLDNDLDHLHKYSELKRKFDQLTYDTNINGTTGSASGNIDISIKDSESTEEAVINNEEAINLDITESQTIDYLESVSTERILRCLKERIENNKELAVALNDSLVDYNTWDDDNPLGFMSEHEKQIQLKYPIVNYCLSVAVHINNKIEELIKKERQSKDKIDIRFEIVVSKWVSDFFKKFTTKPYSSLSIELNDVYYISDNITHTSTNRIEIEQFLKSGKTTKQTKKHEASKDTFSYTPDLIYHLSKYASLFTLTAFNPINEVKHILKPAIYTDMQLLIHFAMMYYSNKISPRKDMYESFLENEHKYVTGKTHKILIDAMNSVIPQLVEHRKSYLFDCSHSNPQELILKSRTGDVKFDDKNMEVPKNVFETLISFLADNPLIYTNKLAQFYATNNDTTIGTFSRIKDSPIGRLMNFDFITNLQIQAIMGKKKKYVSWENQCIDMLDTEEILNELNQIKWIFGQILLAASVFDILKRKDQLDYPISTILSNVMTCTENNEVQYGCTFDILPGLFYVHLLNKDYEDNALMTPTLQLFQYYSLNVPKMRKSSIVDVVPGYIPSIIKRNSINKIHALNLVKTIKNKYKCIRFMNPDIISSLILNFKNYITSGVALLLNSFNTYNISIDSINDENLCISTPNKNDFVLNKLQNQKDISIYFKCPILYGLNMYHIITEKPNYDYQYLHQQQSDFYEQSLKHTQSDDNQN